LRFRLSLLLFIQWAVPGAISPLYSIRLKETLGFDEMTVAACCATQAAATVGSALVAGQVADRWLSAEKTMSICAAVAGLALWLLAGAVQPEAVFLLTLLFWCVTGPTLLLGTAVCFAHLPAPERQFGPVRMWGTVGWMVVGWLLAAWLTRPWASLDDTCRLGALLAFILAAYVLTLPRTPPSQPAGGVRWLAPLEAIRLVCNPTFAVYLVCLLGACVTFPFTVQSTPLLLWKLHIRGAWTSAVLTLAQLTEVILLFVLPALLLRLGVRGTMSLGLAAWLVALSVLWLGRPTGLVVASLGLNGLFVTGFLIAGQVYVNSLAAGDVRASVQGLFTFVNGLGQLAGNLLAGWLRRQTGGEVPPTFAVAVAITAGLFLLFLAGFRPRKQIVT
jgi:MFS family permease